MSDQWNFYPLLVDDEPASIMVNLGIGTAAPVAGYSRMAYLRLYMLQPREDGLSSQKESENLWSLEDTVTRALTRNGETLYVGRSTSSGLRDFYFYTRSISFEQDAASAMSRWPHYEFETGVREDEDWGTYWRFLYPSPEELQRMGNRDVLALLEKNGDTHSIPRTIDHVAYFGSAGGRADFARHATNCGFDVSELKPADDGSFAIEFTRTDRPDQIDDVTIDLFRTAKLHGGDYDGWGCLAVK